MSTFDNSLNFLINTIFDLFLFVLMLRILLVYVGANYFDPLTQLVTKLTNFIVIPVRKLVPNYKKFEVSTIILLFLIEILKFTLILSLFASISNPLGLLILAIADSVKLLFVVLFYAILIQAIISFVQPYSPLSFILHQITQPILRPFQRVIPPVAGFDISPIPALILLQLLQLALVNPLITYGFKATTMS